MKIPQSICILRLSSLGDIVLLTPLIRVLRKQWPNARIDMIVAEKFAEILQNNPRINNLYTINTSQGLFSFIAQKHQLQSTLPHYDLIIDAHGSLRSRYLRLGLGKIIVKYDKFRSYKRDILQNKRRLPLNSIIPIPIRYFSALTSFPEIQPDEFGSECWLPEEKNHGDYPLECRKHQGEIILLAPGAHHATKRWPLHYFVDLIQRLAETLQKPIFLIGGKADKELCDTIANQSKGIAQSVAGTMALSETINLIDRACCVIGNDSGLLHIAASRKVPVTVLYGSTVPEFGFLPYKTEYSIASLDLPCKPCTHIGKKKCPEGHFNCMNNLTPDLVLNKVFSLLDYNAK